MLVLPTIEGKQPSIVGEQEIADAQSENKIGNTLSVSIGIPLRVRSLRERVEVVAIILPSSNRARALRAGVSKTGGVSF